MTDAGAPFGRFLDRTARPETGTWKMSRRRGEGICYIKLMSDGHIYNCIDLIESSALYCEYAAECLADLKAERDGRQQRGIWDPATNRGDPVAWITPPLPSWLSPSSRSTERERRRNQGLGRSPGPPLLVPPAAPVPPADTPQKAVSYKRKVSLDDH